MFRPPPRGWLKVVAVVFARLVNTPATLRNQGGWFCFGQQLHLHEALQTARNMSEKNTDQYVEYWKKNFRGTRPLPTPSRTYVPWEMFEGLDVWDEKHEVMNQLLGKSIEDLINFYLVAIYKIGEKPTWKNRLTARFNRSNLVFWCRHGVCIFFEKCDDCDARNRDNITFLRQLKPKVLAFFSSREFWLGLDGISFEQQVSQLFKQLGKAVELTKASGDGGVDIFLRDDSGLTAVQCKAQQGKVGPSVIRDLYGAMAHFKANRGVVISTGGYTAGAREFAAAKTIDLLDISDLLKLQMGASPMSKTPSDQEFETATDGSQLQNEQSVLPLKSDAFAFIPAGRFRMGDSLNGIRDAPVHTVEIAAFLMAKCEITKALWDEVRNWGMNHGYTDLPEGGGKAENHPVQNITWFSAIKWCNAFSEKQGLKTCYTYLVDTYKSGEIDVDCKWNSNGYRLPTEAEWEKAARGGLSGKQFSSGNEITQRMANFSNGLRKFHSKFAIGEMPYTSPVASFPPNAYGLYDVDGNVSEYCWDRYDDYSLDTQYDPRGPASGHRGRVARGGHWGCVDSYCRVAYRHRQSPSHYPTSGVGFRVARSILT